MTALEDELAGLLGDAAVGRGDSERRLHGEDLTSHAAALPDAVAYVTSTEEVATVLRWADERGVPIVPFGAGTSLEGHVLAVRGGVSLDLSRMNTVLEVRPEDFLARVQAGVTRSALERAAAEHGLRLPVDPGADATLGGMAATNAAGTMTLRFGKMRPQVLALEAVLPGGRVVRTGTAAAKTSAGYDLTGLLVGSEGTLGVITELTLRLVPIPEATCVLQASFPTVAGAAGAVGVLVGLTQEVQRLELLDGWEVAAVNAFAGTRFPEQPMLLVEVAGSTAAVGAAAAEALAVVGEQAGTVLAQEHAPDAQRRLWRIRHDVFFAEKATAPGRESISTDVCVPLGALAATIERTRERLDEHGLTGGIVAHAGDGNVHAGVLIDVGDAGEVERAERLKAALVADALAAGGTCTGEHGVGLGKRDALVREHGDSLDLMRAVKAVFDPGGIMNPGKVLFDA